VIDRGTEVHGPIHSRGILEVRGHVRGPITHDGRLIVAPGGVCSGPVRSVDLYLQGEIHGQVTVTGTLRIGNGGQLYGDADCRRLVIDPGGCFVGINRSEAEGRQAMASAEHAAPGIYGQAPVEAPFGGSPAKPAPDPPPEPAREPEPESAREPEPEPAIVFHGYLRSKRRPVHAAPDREE